ncbi:hypothetical protein BsIDN1_43110 [Bacillus safensis]|uniref:Uncharacterized protein n=1 Tax=Bacillus safensis TaxID=561879 RepID=A0A5S9MC51_BACIA|nr:hypothetical protein BsIDN1_43110 [Bacillus safensis]
MGFQKELKSAELTISFYKKQQLFRVGVSEAASTVERICAEQKTHIDTEEGRVTLKRMKCDLKKKKAVLVFGEGENKRWFIR